MGVDKRKAFVEFLESDMICITTPFRQKTFNLCELNRNSNYINLHTLKTYKAPKEGEKHIPFHAFTTIIEEDKKGNKTFSLIVVAKVSEDEERIIGEMKRGDVEWFKVSVVEH